MLAGAVLPNTCTPEPQQLQQDWNETCAALKITVPSECAAVWQVYNQNSMQAFTAVAAGALGADYQIIATSGSGQATNVSIYFPSVANYLRPQGGDAPIIATLKMSYQALFNQMKSSAFKCRSGI